jgi:membrane fusion protein (multidrug efflux system)
MRGRCIIRAAPRVRDQYFGHRQPSHCCAARKFLPELPNLLIAFRGRDWTIQRMHTRTAGLPAAALIGALGLCALAGCGKQAAPTLGAVEVKAVEIKAQPAQLYADKVGEVRGSQEVDLRARVSGVLIKKHFDDGALVKEGQLLFSIDARDYRAQVASAQAQLASAEANLARAQQDVDRYAPLLAENAISRQVYDSAVATAKQAHAQVEASRASITEAKLAVEFADVRAPLTGRIGAALVFEGGLISAGVTQLATLSKDDPAWVYFSVSEAEVLDYQRRVRLGATDEAKARTVRLQLSDGSIYPSLGHINFIARALDPTTGTFALRAEFPNPEHQLIPGFFARIRVTTYELGNAIIVPDRAVQQQLGSYFVTVVGAEEKAEMRPVKLGPRLGTSWIVSDGLKAGDKVVVEGIQKARPGAPLKVTVVTPDELTAAPPA